MPMSCNVTCPLSCTCCYPQNWLGNQAWARGLKWAHEADFKRAPVTNWTVAGGAAGTQQSAANFTFLRVFAAGHMVPLDQPQAALAMVNDFVSGRI